MRTETNRNENLIQHAKRNLGIQREPLFMCALKRTGVKETPLHAVPSITNQPLRHPRFRAILTPPKSPRRHPIMNDSAKLSGDKIRAVAAWLIVLWMCYIFLGSLPYKFTGHPDTQHIFGTIGGWMSGIFGDWLGAFFTAYGAYLVGSFELLTSLILLLPATLWLLTKIGLRSGGSLRGECHRIGGLMAAAVMCGAVFFHLFTPLGIEVLHQGKSDGGSLFYAAVSILILGIVLFFINIKRER